MQFVQAQTSDLDNIKSILTQWKKPEEVEEFIDQFQNSSITQFFLAKDNDKVLGLVALDKLNPELSQFGTSNNPQQITVLHIGGNASGKGVGSFLVDSIEKEAKSQNITQLLVASPNQYKMGKIGFYEKMGYQKIGEIQEDKWLNIFSKTFR